jgi:hypothetical protein
VKVWKWRGHAAFKGVWNGSGRRTSTAHCRVGAGGLQLRLAHGPGEGGSGQWARRGNGVLWRTMIHQSTILRCDMTSGDMPARIALGGQHLDENGQQGAGDPGAGVVR